MQSQVNELVSVFVETRFQAEPEEGEFPTSGPEELAGIRARLERVVAGRTSRLRDMLTEMEQVSRAFLHEMRSPLCAVQGVGMLLDRAVVDVSIAEREECARRIRMASSRLDKLIQNVSAYYSAVARILPLQAVDLSRLISGLVEKYPEFQPDNADIQTEGNLPIVLGNETLLTQCFSNLLDNAVKFTPPGTSPHVRLHAECVHDHARIWVKDNGIGIPRQAQSQLFGLFQKVDLAREGAGLGLAVVRTLVERMDGRVGVESEPDAGSRFWVELKLAEPT